MRALGGAGPVYSIRRPSEQAVRDFLADMHGRDLSYGGVGATREIGLRESPKPPRGSVLDRNRVRLGYGDEVFARARAALMRWEMFRVGWAELLWPDASIARGTTVGVLVHLPGVWSLCAARIVYTVEELGHALELERYGFAYGTLPGHVARGEERFSVERSRDDDVWYEMLAFSRLGGLARCAAPYARQLQRRFARDSLAAMRRCVAPGQA